MPNSLFLLLPFHLLSLTIPNEKNMPMTGFELQISDPPPLPIGA